MKFMVYEVRLGESTVAQERGISDTRQLQPITSFSKARMYVINGNRKKSCQRCCVVFGSTSIHGRISSLTKHRLFRMHSWLRSSQLAGRASGGALRRRIGKDRNNPPENFTSSPADCH